MTLQQPTLPQLLTQLSDEKLLSTSDKETLEQLSKDRAIEGDDDVTDKKGNEEHVPWYIKGLIGFSAWLSAVFMIAFLALAQIFRAKASFIILGLAFLGFALIMYHGQQRMKSIFVDQFALSMAMTGRILMAIGFAVIFKNEVTTAFGIILMEAVVITLYPDWLQRFVSTIVIHASALFIFGKWKANTLTYVYVGMMALLLRAVWVRVPALASTKLREFLAPVGYATATGILMLMAFSTMRDSYKIIGVHMWMPVTATLTVMWLLVCTDIAKDYNISPTDTLPMVAAAIGILFCAAGYNAPGIAASCFVMTIGFYRRERTLVGLAVASLVGFVSFYYYSLSISLLIKSIALFVPGVVLLVSRAIFFRMVDKSIATQAPEPA